MKNTLTVSQQATLRHRQTLLAMFSKMPELPDMSEHLNPPFIRWILATVQPIFENEPNVLVLSSPIHICGDIHGQLHDLLSIFSLGGLPPNQKFLFLGDYVDRGSESVEVICLLFCLKILYPNRVFLLRGNHESREMTRVFGFSDECRAKLNKQMHKFFCMIFNKMPLCSLIDDRIFCVHGGISPSLTSLDQIQEIDRFGEIPEEGLFSDLMWSDPSPKVDEWAPSDRGCTFLWGLAPVKKFLSDNNMAMVVRGHQVAKEGFNFPFEPDHCVVTVFSATNYADEYRNKGCFMSIAGDGKMTFTDLPFMPPKARATSRHPVSKRQLKLKRKKRGRR